MGFCGFGKVESVFKAGEWLGGFDGFGPLLVGNVLPGEHDVGNGFSGRFLAAKEYGRRFDNRVGEG